PRRVVCYREASRSSPVENPAKGGTMRAGTSLVLIAVCAFVDGGISREAAAAVLCQKKTGAILVRPDACKKKESPFDLTPFVTPALPQRGLSDTVIVTESDTTPASTFDKEHTVACPAGYQAIGGGVAGEYNQIGVDASGPTIGGAPTKAHPARPPPR